MHGFIINFDLIPISEELQVRPQSCRIDDTDLLTPALQVSRQGKLTTGSIGIGFDVGREYELLGITDDLENRFPIALVRICCG